MSNADRVLGFAIYSFIAYIVAALVAAAVGFVLYYVGGMKFVDVEAWSKTVMLFVLIYLVFGPVKKTN